MTTSARLVSEIRELVGPWTHPEQLAQKLRLDDFRPCVGAALALLDNVIVWDPSLPSEETERLLARACARHLIRLGAACSEDELADEILRVSRVDAMARTPMRERTRSACAL
jgi:hypothetical protein